MQLLNKISREQTHFPTGASRIFNNRSVNNGHQHLAKLLQPGMAILDIGCGPGSITRGIAQTVTPKVEVIGIDINPHFIEEARHNHSHIPNLSFQEGDIYNLPFHQEFDIVIANRVFHWLTRPFDALKMMMKCTKPGGRIVIHDSNLEKTVWQPDPPQSMKNFYSAFLKWRSSAGMDNTIANNLSEIFHKAGLVDIVETPQHEVTKRTDSDFETRIGIWADIAAIEGPQMIQDGIITEHQWLATQVEYRHWVRHHAESHSIYFITIEGTLPIAP